MKRVTKDLRSREKTLNIIQSSYHRPLPHNQSREVTLADIQLHTITPTMSSTCVSTQIFIQAQSAS